MIRRLVIVTALCLCGTSASAELAMQECRAQYKAARAKKIFDESWTTFQQTQCGIKPRPSRPKGATPKNKKDQ